MKKTKWVLNEDKLLRNIAIVTTVPTLISLIVNIAHNGITWISTIGYF